MQRTGPGTRKKAVPKAWDSPVYQGFCVIEDSQIIERGDHDDLLAQRGRYDRLYTGQSELDWRDDGAWASATRY